MKPEDIETFAEDTADTLYRMASTVDDIACLRRYLRDLTEYRAGIGATRPLEQVASGRLGALVGLAALRLTLIGSALGFGTCERLGRYGMNKLRRGLARLAIQSDESTAALASTGAVFLFPAT